MAKDRVVGPVRVDRRHAKKACVWLKDQCMDIASLGELMSLRANRLYASKVSISSMSDLQNVAKVVESLKKLVKLSTENLNDVNDHLTHCFDRWADKYTLSSHSDGSNSTMQDVEGIDQTTVPSCRNAGSSRKHNNEVSVPSVEELMDHDLSDGRSSRGCLREVPDVGEDNETAILDEPCVKDNSSSSFSKFGSHQEDHVATDGSRKTASNDGGSDLTLHLGSSSEEDSNQRSKKEDDEKGLVTCIGKKKLKSAGGLEVEGDEARVQTSKNTEETQESNDVNDEMQGTGGDRTFLQDLESVFDRCLNDDDDDDDDKEGLPRSNASELSCGETLGKGNIPPLSASKELGCENHEKGNIECSNPFEEMDRVNHGKGRLQTSVMDNGKSQPSTANKESCGKISENGGGRQEELNSSTKVSMLKGSGSGGNEDKRRCSKVKMEAHKVDNGGELEESCRKEKIHKNILPSSSKMEVDGRLSGGEERSDDALLALSTMDVDEQLSGQETEESFVASRDDSLPSCSKEDVSGQLSVVEAEESLGTSYVDSRPSCSKMDIDECLSGGEVEKSSCSKVDVEEQSGGSCLKYTAAAQKAMDDLLADSTSSSLDESQSEKESARVPKHLLCRRKSSQSRRSSSRSTEHLASVEKVSKSRRLSSCSTEHYMSDETQSESQGSLSCNTNRKVSESGRCSSRNTDKVSDSARSLSRSVDHMSEWGRSSYNMDHHMMDEKLRNRCEVRLERLSSSVLRHFVPQPSAELDCLASGESSDEVHQDIRRLLNIQTLTRKRQKIVYSDSDESGDEGSLVLPPRSRKKGGRNQEEQKARLSETRLSSSEEGGDTAGESEAAGAESSACRDMLSKQMEEDFECKKNWLAKEALLKPSSSDETEWESSNEDDKNRVPSPVDDQEGSRAIPSPSLLNDMVTDPVMESASLKSTKGVEEEANAGSAEEPCDKDAKQESSWRNNTLLRGKLTDSPPSERKAQKGKSPGKVMVLESSAESQDETKTSGIKRTRSSSSDSLVMKSPVKGIVVESSEESQDETKSVVFKRSRSSSNDSHVTKKAARENLDTNIIELSSSDDDSDIFIPVRRPNPPKKSSATTSSFGNENGIVRRYCSSGRGSSIKDWLVTSKKEPKRRPSVIKKTTSSDSDDDKNITPSPSKQDTPNKGRRNIRALMADDSIAEATQVAVREETERRKRIAEKQKMYNDMCGDMQKSVDKVESLVLDIDPKTRKTLVEVDKKLACKLKPHQVKGIKFMWDACFESLQRAQDTRGSGCILAHCMGLGKTFQVITLAHTVIRHKETKVQTVLIVCPLSTVLNWVNEFNMWLRETDQVWKVKVFELSRCKQNYDRGRLLQTWHNGGGVMVVGYEMFRALTNLSNGKVFQNTLLDPGPDMVVCDEGHLLKNERTALSKAMLKIRTLRRIVLTGTPLQNNLKEYHCMVQFVKPNLLGTLKEFRNRFVNPINNGQFEDSTPHDVKIMKRRAHVLHKMLEGCVQRFDYSILRTLLPPKHEYVISVRLTDLQIKMYERYLSIRLQNDGLQNTTKGAQLFTDFQALQKVWTHPLMLKMSAERNRKNDKPSVPDSFLKNHSSSEKENVSSESDDSDCMIVDDDGSAKPWKKAFVVKEEPPEPTLQGEWWADLLKGGEMEDLRESGKLVLLFSILRDCQQINDKLLVFSQSLFSLDLIEYFLKRINRATKNNMGEDQLFHHTGSWVAGKDYFRLDGSTSGENRATWCKTFNHPSNTRARLFLISTRAGGLGINLFGANRAIIFDASWNPSHDVQSIFRVYRFGQKKPCFIYRFLASGTMEEKIYDRQVTKLSLSKRVVDEQQIERHFNMSDLAELYRFTPELKTKRPTPILPKDVLLAELLKEHEAMIDTYHEHDSLLENKQEEELNEEERKAAWEDYENERRGPQPVPGQGESSLQRNPNSNLRDFYDVLKYKFPYLEDRLLHERAQFLLRRLTDLRGSSQAGTPSSPPLYTRRVVPPPPAHQAVPAQQLRQQQRQQLQQDEALMARHSMAALSGRSRYTPRPVFRGPPPASSVGPRFNPMHRPRFSPAQPAPYTPRSYRPPMNRFTVDNLSQQLRSLLQNNPRPSFSGSRKEP